MPAEWGLGGYEGLLVSHALAVFGLGGCCLKHTFIVSFLYDPIREVDLWSPVYSWGN